jgi:hypothetical protein
LVFGLLGYDAMLHCPCNIVSYYQHYTVKMEVVLDFIAIFNLFLRIMVYGAHFVTFLGTGIAGGRSCLICKFLSDR